MSYNTIICVILIVLVIYVCLTPLLYMKAVKFGVKMAEKPEEAAEEPFFHVPAKHKPPKMTPEEERDMQILANIQAYNGTSAGQIKIQKEKE